MAVRSDSCYHAPTWASTAEYTSLWSVAARIIKEEPKRRIILSAVMGSLGILGILGRLGRALTDKNYPYYSYYL